MLLLWLLLYVNIFTYLNLFLSNYHLCSLSNTFDLHQLIAQTNCKTTNQQIKSASFRMKSATSKVVTALDVSVVVMAIVSGVYCGLFSLNDTLELNSRLTKVRFFYLHICVAVSVIPSFRSTTLWMPTTTSGGIDGEPWPWL